MLNVMGSSGGLLAISVHFELFVHGVKRWRGREYEKTNLANEGGMAEWPPYEGPATCGNSLEGMISESHFTNLSNLTELDLSCSSLTIKISPSWAPPFQLQYLKLQSCKQDSRFLNWLHTQNDLRAFEFFNAGNLDQIPHWFWGKLQEITFMNISLNNLHGKIPNLALEFTNNPEIDLSWNQFEGSIPLFLLQALALHLSNNKFSISVCGRSTSLGLMDLSNNQLEGKLPNCWNNLNSSRFLDRSNNKLSGKFPFSMGALANIEGLVLRNYSLNGQVPSSLENYSKLALFDLGENKFCGPIPLWIGESLQLLQILSLRLNYFHGRGIPACIKNFTAMAQDTTSSTPTDSGNWYITYKDADGFYTAYYDLYLFLEWKGVDRGFKNAGSPIPMMNGTSFAVNKLNCVCLKLVLR
ncbi:hypothetical protein VNO77_24515 [Canavalia gladiata]|uniref:Uncharacterized protein n=1 Tax=Canavalia gladiata TaxID=3824 RepID=A0AAN9L6G0_CANGL